MKTTSPPISHLFQGDVNAAITSILIARAPHSTPKHSWKHFALVFYYKVIPAQRHHIPAYVNAPLSNQEVVLNATKILLWRICK
jgi:hypothetical protein